MDIQSNLAQVRRNIQEACSRAGRDPSEVLLLPVSKGHSADVIRAAADLGLNVFAENKIQEAKVKISQCPGRLRWHMIGHLQSNKCRDAVHFFEMIQSVDSIELAVEINKAAEKAAKYIPTLLEVNVAGEATKFGFKPEQLLDSLETLNSLSRLEIHGLMTIAPWTQDSEKVRPFFKQLRELKDQCSERLGAPLLHLSMGMSGDYQVAIEEGATIVRIGTALFGSRQKKTTTF
jgi:pyridoxal phosphate enzyme (YggS family)